ncbi:MAG: flagellar basal body P-ring formation chaperone FlgA [Gemmatimonadota bacterium]|nr:flagellar basal body P-ring formation chaperone FlgA [Gemmatimonadota bacterium]
MTRFAIILTLLSLAAELSAGPLSTAPTAAGIEKAYICLNPEAEVTGWQIVLSDVAQVEGFNEELITRLESLALGPAPLPGDKLTLDKTEIRRRLVVGRIDPVKVALVGADKVTVSRSGRPVEQGELKALVDDYLRRSWEGQDVRTEITYSRIPENVSLSDSNLKLRIVNPMRTRISGSMSLSIAAVDNQERLVQRLPVSLKVRSFEKVAVLKNSLTQGDMLGPDDVELAERETTGLHRAPVKSIAEIAGTRLKRRMKAGQLLTADCIENPPLVERGDNVNLVVYYKNIRVGCSGTAWQNGRRGEKILVRNQYGRNLMGTVQDANTVVISQ